MDAAAFLGSSTDTKLIPCPVEWFFALAKLAVGILLFWGVARFVPQEYTGLTGWIGMTGIVMTLHFGLFHLLSCGWRTIGVDARPLMNWPLTSRSISEFWGVRWNTAFRDLTHRFLFRPLVPRFGVRGAVFVGFFASGLIHDVVISIPAAAGYGGPTLFFLVQGCAILVSRSATAKRIGLRKGFVGWSFTLLALLLPVFLLFHPAFVREVIVPFMKVVGAIG
jgi:D-alanyl-lipoteichoic acid acyltransferase DltB (MBOAT superfamily)